jgi:hypothetical protein
MNVEYIAGILGGLLGGFIGGIGGWFSAYVAPRKLEEERERRLAEKIWGPRKKLISEMLDNAAIGQGRSFETLKRVTGTPDDELRRLLVELGARGFTRSDGKEGWIYAKDRPLTKIAEDRD